MFLKWLKNIDWLLLLLTLSLSIAGLIALKSVSLQMIINSGQNPFIKQLIFVIIGVILALVLANMPTKTFYKYAWGFYIFSILLLLFVIITGRTGSGATRWIRIFGVQFQPSEFAKIAVLLGLARYLSDTKSEINSFKVLIISMLIIGVPWFLIFLEPDLGTSLVFLAFFFPVLYWVDFKFTTIVLIVSPLFIMISVSNNHLLIGISLILFVFLIFLRIPLKWKILVIIINIGFALSATPVWNSLKPYQQKRILTFMDPSADPKGAGYQVIQSMVTVGSGGISGQGYKMGSQTQLGFIPEQHTDFIFTVIGEEFGFIGVMSVLMLFLFAVWRIIWIGKNGKTTFTGLISIGIATIISFHFLVNVGMTLGVMPVTGLPLPFLSFGRSSLIAFFVMIGLCLNFYKNRMEY